jgi:DNA-binding IclR family transcriptional regulator
MSGGSGDAGRSVTSRALAVLGGFDERHPRLTLSQLSRRADLPLTTTHRLVGELVRWQALARRDDGSYEIGRRIWHLGLLAPVHHGLREVALPFMQDLHTATAETVHLAVRDGITALYVERVLGSSSAPVVSRAGHNLPLHATGVGKILLAHAPAAVVEQALADPERVTAYTITERGRLLRELAEARRRGYARTGEEMTLGTSSLAVAVFDVSGHVVAALGIVVNSARRDLLRLVPVLQVAASGISRGLGAAGGVFP